MSEKEILNNIMAFVNENVIVAGYGYEYKIAIRNLYDGVDLDSVNKWYEEQVGKY